MKKIVGIFVCTLLFATLLPITVTADETFGKTITVDDDGGADYTNIQDAIDNASDGDTVFVYSGMYYGLIIINKTVTLTGEEKASTIIDGQQLGEDTITVNAPNVHISEFTIQNGPRGCGYNSGVKLEYADDCVIENIIFTDNCWAAEIRSSNNCIFSDNSVIDNEQGGLHIVFSDSTTVTDCTFSGNGKTGIIISKGNNHVISSNTFIDCGIELYAELLPRNIVHCTFTDNTVNGKPLVYLEHENGKFVRNAGQVILNHCNGIIVRNNELTNTSTGVEVIGSTFVRIIGNTITDNFHGISVDKSIAVNIRNNNVTNNWYCGIGLYHSSFCRISFNEVSGNDVGVYLFDTLLNLLYLNSVHNNERYNYQIDSALLPFTIRL